MHSMHGGGISHNPATAHLAAEACAAPCACTCTAPCQVHAAHSTQHTAQGPRRKAAALVNVAYRAHHRLQCGLCLLAVLVVLDLVEAVARGLQCVAERCERNAPELHVVGGVVLVLEIHDGMHLHAEHALQPHLTVHAHRAVWQLTLGSQAVRGRRDATVATSNAQHPRGSCGHDARWEVCSGSGEG